MTVEEHGRRQHDFGDMLSLMDCTEDVPVVSVTARTEYSTERHRTSATTSKIALVSSLIALVALNLCGYPPVLTSGIVAVLVTVGLGAATYGWLEAPGAVQITVDEITVYFGIDRTEIVSRPLSSLIGVSRAGPADETTPDRRRLTVRAQEYLVLTFDSDTGRDEWRVAVIESDPAAAEVFRRLTTALPEAHKSESAATAHSAARIADAGTDEAAKRLWEEATRRHDDVLNAYGIYELDPTMLLRYPAVTDVTVGSTQTFHIALDEAQALRTDACPGNRGLADAYQQAVVRLRRAWIACESHGRRAGTSYLEAADQTELDTALKLYHHAASSTTPAEQATYYGRVREIITRLTDRGALHPPEVQLTELEGITRRAIEAAKYD